MDRAARMAPLWPKRADRARDHFFADLYRSNAYAGHISREEAEGYLTRMNIAGAFLFYSTNDGSYLLQSDKNSSYHQREVKNIRGRVSLNDGPQFKSVNDLLNHHENSKRSPLTRHAEFADWEISPRDLRLGNILGQGMYGIVRRAVYLRQEVAVKELIHPDTNMEQGFFGEMRIMMGLEHENIVKCIGVCSKQRPFYIVTEFMRNGDLSSYIKKERHQLLNEELEYMCYQVSRGMKYLELNGLVHGDLHLGNCLVGANRVVKISDFGQSRSCSAGSDSNDVAHYGNLVANVFWIAAGHDYQTKPFESIGFPPRCSTKIKEVITMCTRNYPSRRMPNFCELEKIMWNIHAVHEEDWQGFSDEDETDSGGVYGF